MAFSESPDNCLENTLNNFPKFSFVWAQELKIPKMAIFGVASKLRVKPKMAENVLGQSRKIYYIKLAQYFVVLQRRYINVQHLHTGCSSL